MNTIFQFTYTMPLRNACFIAVIIIVLFSCKKEPCNGPVSVTNTVDSILLERLVMIDTAGIPPQNTAWYKCRYDAAKRNTSGMYLYYRAGGYDSTRFSAFSYNGADTMP